MKKSTLMIIGIIYIASIVVISIFGMRAIIYKEVIPVASIECINETDEKVAVSMVDGKKVLKIKYTTPGTLDGQGTCLYLVWDIKPVDASNKHVEFIYDETDRVEFVEKDGQPLGMVLIKGKVTLNLKIMSIDGGRVSTEIIIWAY